MNRRTKFHQTSVDDVVEVTDELVRFQRSRVQGQGQCNVKHWSELLRQAEATTSPLGLSKSYVVFICFMINAQLSVSPSLCLLRLGILS